MAVNLLITFSYLKFLTILNLKLLECRVVYDGSQSSSNSTVSDQILTNKHLTQLTSTILFKFSPGHCYGLITDREHDQVFNRYFFEVIKEKPLFLAKVSTMPNDEFSPQFIATLAEIKNAECGLYLILIKNGTKMGSLLKYGNYKRLFSSRAKYIFLYDYQIFMEDLHFIWRRLINAIFVRRYTGGQRNSTAVFELSTVPFPQTIGEVFVTKQLDFWRDGKFRFGVNLFRTKTNDLAGKLINIAIYTHVPATYKNQIGNETEFNGLEVEIIKSLSSSMNFTYEFYESENADQEKWGRQSDNETISGLLGEIINDFAGIALGNLQFTQFNFDFIDLSVPYLMQCYTFLTPESSQDNSWKTLILPFNGEMWLGVLLTLFSVGFIFYGLSRFHRNLNRAHKILRVKRISYRKNVTSVGLSRRIILKANRPKIVNDIFDEITTCIMYTWSMVVVVSLPRLPRSWSIRLLTGWYMIYCLLVAVAYRSSMTAILANPVPKVKIDTLEELANSQHIGYGAWGEQTKKFFVNSLDEASQKIGNKLDIVENADEAVDKIVRGSYAYYENEYFLKKIRSIRNSSVERETLHIMEECVINMPISIGMQKNSPIKEVVNEKLRHLIESGLIDKWLKDGIRHFQSNVESTSQEALMDLKKLYGAFVALFIGYTISFIALLGEKIYFKFVTEKRPGYDRLLLGQTKSSSPI